MFFDSLWDAVDLCGSEVSARVVQVLGNGGGDRRNSPKYLQFAGDRRGVDGAGGDGFYYFF